MRSLAFFSLLALCACSDGGGEAPKAKSEPATALQPGQWEVTSEVTRFAQNDKGAPKINTPAGTKATHSVCVDAADAKKPKPELFAGTEAQCKYNEFYMSRGALNAQLACTRPGLSGDVMMTAAGDFEATTFNTTLDTSTSLSTDGDVTIASKLTGRRTGECTAAPTDAKG